MDIISAKMCALKLRKRHEKTVLNEKELSLLRTTSKLSDKEIKLWYSEFIAKYPSGKLDKTTFVDAVKQFCPSYKTDLARKTLCDSTDINKDGVIDFSEFLFIAALSGRSGTIDERLDVMFELWDVSDDGKLDQNELAHIISAMYDRAGVTDRQGDKDPQAHAKKIITKLDSSGDKKLSREEFINGCKHDEAILKLLTTGQ